jgi:hypothetical protein
LDPEGTQQHEELIHRARALRSAIHGFIDLELREGFGLPVAIDRSFDWLVAELAKIVSREQGQSTCRYLSGKRRLVRRAPNLQ